MMKPTIIAIVGASGSGKTYLSKFLQREKKIPVIVSYTTRPKRESEIEGEDYFFVTDQIFFHTDILTYTHFGEYEYFALRRHLPEKGLCTYVLEESGLETLLQQRKRGYEVISVALKCKTETLVARGIEPERIARDELRQALPDSRYDFIIHNDDSIEKFESDILNMIKRMENGNFQD